MPSSVQASDSWQPRRRQGAELHMGADRWLASARRGRSTWRYAHCEMSRAISDLMARKLRIWWKVKLERAACLAGRCS